MTFDEYKKIFDRLKYLGFIVDFKCNVVFKFITANYYLNDERVILFTAFHGKAPEGFNDFYSVHLIMENKKSYSQSPECEKMFLYSMGEAMGIADNCIKELKNNGFQQSV